MVSNASIFERVLVAGLGAASLLFLIGPMLVVGLASLDPGQFFTFPPTQLSTRWYAELATSAPWRDSFLLTILIALLAASGSTIVGTLAGLGVARVPRRFRGIAYALLVGPMVTPVIVMSISYYRLVLEAGLVGNLGAFVVANMLLTTPLVALFVVGASFSLDAQLEHASLSLGAGPWQTLLRVTLPAVAPAAVTGFVVAFLYAVDEVVMSILLVSPNMTPLAVRMFLEVQQGTAPLVTAVATTLMAASMLGALALILGRNLLGSGGRDPAGLAMLAAPRARVR